MNFTFSKDKWRNDWEELLKMSDRSLIKDFLKSPFEYE